jgi:hypothetical protein
LRSNKCHLTDSVVDFIYTIRGSVR